MDTNLKLPTDILEPMILAYSRMNPSFFLKINKYLDTNGTRKSYFNDEKNQRMFNIISKFYMKYKNFPKRTVLKAIIDKIEKDSEIKFLMLSIADKIYETSSNEIDQEWLEEEVKNFIMETQVYEAIIESQPDIEGRNFGAVVERIQNAVRVNFDKDLGLSILDIDESIRRIKRLDEEACIDSGYQHINNLLDGGFHPKEIYCVAAIPGGGKTLFLGNLALNMFLSGKKVLVYTFETSTERTLMRYFSNMAGMGKKDILSSEDTLRNRLKNVYNMTDVGDLIIKEYNANEVCSNDLMANINDLKMYQDFVPDIVIVDYILIMRANDKKLSSEDTYNYYKKVTEELRNIGKSLYIPIVTACQINREGMADKGGSKAQVTSKNISESRGIYDTVDVFWTIIQTSSDKTNEKFSLYFDKSRNDKTGVKISFDIDYEHMKIEEKGIL